MASPSSWSSAFSDDSALTFYSHASSTLTQSGLPPVWFDDNRQRNISFLIHYTDDLEGIVDGVHADSPLQNFDLMDFALSHNFINDDEAQFVERINLYNLRARHNDAPLNPQASWTQNDVIGADTVSFVPVFKKVELHFKFVFADIKKTRVIDVEITDCLLDVLHDLQRTNPEMTGLRFDDLKVYYQCNLVNDKPWYAIYEIIDHEKNKSFYNFEVQVCGRGGGGGGTKRKAISISEMTVKEEDHPNAKAVFNIKSFISRGWLHSLNDEDLKVYFENLKSARGFPGQVEATLNKIREYQALKARVFRSSRSLNFHFINPEVSLHSLRSSCEKNQI